MIFRQCWQRPTGHRQIWAISAAAASPHYRTRAEMPVTMIRVNILNGTQPLLQIAEGYTVDLPDEIHQPLDERTDKTWPTTWFVPNLTGEGAFTDVYHVMANWGCKPRLSGIRAYRSRPDHAGKHAADSGFDAQCFRRPDLSSAHMECLWHQGSGGRGLSCVCRLRSALLR